MYELVYSSKESEDFTLEDIFKIEKNSKLSNQELDISGCLVHIDNNFVAILEGKKENVHSLFNKIKGDTRHSNIEILYSNTIARRQFNTWNIIYQIPIVKNEIAAIDNLFRENLLSLTILADKNTYGAKVFWNKIKDLLTAK